MRRSFTASRKAVVLAILRKDLTAGKAVVREKVWILMNGAAFMKLIFDANKGEMKVKERCDEIILKSKV